MYWMIPALLLTSGPFNQVFRIPNSFLDDEMIATIGWRNQHKAQLLSVEAWFVWDAYSTEVVINNTCEYAIECDASLVQEVTLVYPTETSETQSFSEPVYSGTLEPDELFWTHLDIEPGFDFYALLWEGTSNPPEEYTDWLWFIEVDWKDPSQPDSNPDVLGCDPCLGGNINVPSINFGFQTINQFQWWCEGDVDNDGVVGLDDLLLVLINWGEAVPYDLADIVTWDTNQDGEIDVLDLTHVQANWGPCPSNANN